MLLPALPAVAGSRGLNDIRGSRTLRFGVVTDVHYADRDQLNGRFYRDSLAKMRDAIACFNRSDLDFIIELGDLKDIALDKDAGTTLRYLDDIEKALQGFNGPVYHVLGNHDMDCLSKSEFLSHTSNPGSAAGRSFYAFTKRGVRCIVLDANYNEDRTPYERGNFDWKSAWIPDGELQWLEKELSTHRRQPTLVFIHQMLDRFSDISPSYCVGNADDVVSVLESNPQVLAVLQGHRHAGHYSERNGIHYITFGGMISGAYPEHQRYAVVELRPDGSIAVDGFGDCPDRALEAKKC